MDNLNVQNTQPNSSYFLNVNTFKGMCSTHGSITDGLFKHFISLRHSFLEVKMKYDADSLVLKVCRFTVQ